MTKLNFKQFQKELFESISYPTEFELRKKELEFHIGDRVHLIFLTTCTLSPI